jgi:hypothetical protein
VLVLLVVGADVVLLVVARVWAAPVGTGTVAPSGQNLLPGQAVHATSLVEFLYVPTGHGTQSTSMHPAALVPFEAFVALQ